MTAGPAAAEPGRALASIPSAIGTGAGAGSGLHIGEMTVNNPAYEVDIVSALQRGEWLAG